MTIDGAHAHDLSAYDTAIADLLARAPVPGPAGAIGPAGPQGPSGATGPAGPACISDMSDPVVYIGPGSSNSNDTAALAAGAALVAAVAALPVGTNPGGIIQLDGGGRGFYTLSPSGAASLLDLRNRSFVHIRGAGGASGGAAGGTVIETYSAGSGGIVLLGDTKSITFKDLMIRYQSPSFTGRLLDTTSAILEADHLRLENVILGGPKTAGQTACLLYLNHSATSVFDRVNFDGGGYQVIGQRNVRITGVSIGNPTVITAPLHGYATGQYVTIGGTATTPTVNTDEGWPITVIDVSRFSIPVNVTAVAIGTGGTRSNNRDFNNAMTFRDCLWINAGIMAVWNPGKSWVFLNPTVEYLASGAAGFMGHDPGNHSKGLSILGGWMGDQTTSGTTEQWITYSGTGFSCRGAFISGNQNTFTTAVRFDDNGCSGWEFVGNALSNMYRDVDFAAGPAPGGLYAGNGHNNVKAAWAAFKGTIPPGQAFGDPSKPTRPSMFVSW